MLTDLERNRGAENVRLLGHRGTAGRGESRAMPAAATTSRGIVLDDGMMDDEG